MISYKSFGFDWNDGNAEKCEQHGVTLREIEFLFESDPLISPDIRHSTDEDRLIAVGRVQKGRMVYVAFTLRGEDGNRMIRPISARYMHMKEYKRYA